MVGVGVMPNAGYLIMIASPTTTGIFAKTCVGAGALAIEGIFVIKAVEQVDVAFNALAKSMEKNEAAEEAEFNKQ